MDDKKCNWGDVVVTLGGREITGIRDLRYRSDERPDMVIIEDVGVFEIESPHIAEITKLAARFAGVTATLTLSTQEVRRFNRLLRIIKKKRFCKQNKKRLPRKLKKQQKKMLKQ